MTKKYIEPNWDENSFTCPYCNTISLMQFKRVNYQNLDAGFSGKTNGWGDSWVGIATCYNLIFFFLLKRLFGVMKIIFILI